MYGSVRFDDDDGDDDEYLSAGTSTGQVQLEDKIGKWCVCCIQSRTKWWAKDVDRVYWSR